MVGHCQAGAARQRRDLLQPVWPQRLCAPRFWKCFVAGKRYREGGRGFLIAVCAGLYPLLSYLKARYQDEIEETREP